MRPFTILAAIHLLVACGIAQPVVITEINYNSSSFFNPEDWVEFYNNSGQNLDISGWIFKDEVDTQSFTFPENTILEPGGFVVMCIDTNLFKVHFVGVDCFVGNFTYGLSGGGELIRLYDTAGYVVDYLIYDDQIPWPPQPNGLGPTLELIHPSLDNTLAESWQSSSDNGFPFGSPGMAGWLGIEKESNKNAIPTEIQLFQNFPNPFNLTTTLRFWLSRKEYVSLTLFNAQGQTVKQLLECVMHPGKYEILLDATGFPSGIYLARLSTGEMHETVNMILTK